MSGIVAIWNKNEAPVNSRLLNAMTGSLSYRGPDGQQSQLFGHVGLGHAALNLFADIETVAQPANLAEKFWITADARIDGRAELVARLKSCFPEITTACPDQLLILYAYAKWGRNCTDHLIGDFSFVIWDNQSQNLFCACDHFSIGQLFYAETAEAVIVSNSIDTILLHGGVSDELEPLAIADYLLFRRNTDPERTFYKGVTRCPASHFISVKQDVLEKHRYFSPANNTVSRNESAQDLIEEFRSLFDICVSDRIRSSKIGTHISGGLDSASVTVTANRILQNRNAEFSHHAYTMSTANVQHCEEAIFAGETCSKYPIDHQIIHSSDFPWEIDSEYSGYVAPEPTMFRTSSPRQAILEHGNNHSRLILSGEGGDPLMAGAKEGLSWQRMLGNPGASIRGIVQFNSVHGRLPPGLRAIIPRVKSKSQGLLQQFEPIWLNPEFLETNKLSNRYHAYLNQRRTDLVSHQSGMYQDDVWTRVFAWHDPNVTGMAVKTAHPFFDKRLIDFAQSVPIDVLGFRKYMLRESMKQRLPKNHLTRKKTARSGHPFIAMLQNGKGLKQYKMLLAESDISEYVDKKHLSVMLENAGKYHPGQIRTLLRPLSLALWMCNRRLNKRKVISL